MNHSKRLAALFLVAVMALSLLALPVFAEEEAPDPVTLTLQNLNVARQKDGKETVQELPGFSAYAQEILDNQIAYDQGRITEEEFKATDKRNEQDSADRYDFKVADRTEAIISFILTVSTESHIKNGDWSTGLAVRVPDDAKYVGLAITEDSGKSYCVLIVSTSTVTYSR